MVASEKIKQQPVNPAPASGKFWLFWLGQTTSTLGSSFVAFALPLLVFKLTGSALGAVSVMITFLCRSRGSAGVSLLVGI